VRRFAVCAAIAVATFAERASAHLLASNRGTLVVKGSSVFAALSVPVAALDGFDDDGDGLLGAAELARHGDTLRAQIDRRSSIEDGAARGETVSLDLVLSPEHDAAQDRASQVVVLKHVAFAHAPRELRASFDLFDPRDPNAELVVTASRRDGAPTAGETCTLRPTARDHAFFAEPPRTAPRAIAAAVALACVTSLWLASRRRRAPAVA
jgi:hypothetical protein